MDTYQQSRETEAFLDALQGISPQTVSACDGWTAHEVTAHLAAGAAEVTRHLDPYLEGRAVPRTRGFEEREPFYRAMEDHRLRSQLAVEEERMRRAIGEVLNREPEAVIPWTGRHMAVSAFIPHMRNEFAVHRWDVTGDDALGDELLGQLDLTVHAVRVLGPLLLARGRAHDPAAGEDFRVRLRASGAPDVRVIVESGRACVELGGDGEEGEEESGVELSQAARVLVLWGRRPGRREQFRSDLPSADLARLQALLSGY